MDFLDTDTVVEAVSILLMAVIFVALLFFMVGCSASSLGDQTVHSGIGTIHEPCPGCLMVNVTAHVEVYPDDNFFDNISQFVEGWNPSAVAGALVTSPMAGTIESATGKRRWEINVSVRVPPSVAKNMELSDIKDSIEEAVNAIEKEKLQALQGQAE